MSSAAGEGGYGARSGARLDGARATLRTVRREAADRGRELLLR